MPRRTKWIVWQKGELQTFVKNDKDLKFVILQYVDFKPKKTIMLKKVM